MNREYDEVNIALIELYTAAQNHPLYETTKKREERIVTHRGLLKNPDYLFIGEAPGKEEAKRGMAFVGRSGELLDKVIDHCGLREYCIINAIPLMPLDKEGKIRKPYETEINYFRKHTEKLIKAINPRYIILLGKSATESIGQAWNPLTWNNKTATIYHPAYYLRGNRNIYRDMKQLMEAKP